MKYWFNLQFCNFLFFLFDKPLNYQIIKSKCAPNQLSVSFSNQATQCNVCILILESVSYRVAATTSCLLLIKYDGLFFSRDQGSNTWETLILTPSILAEVPPTREH